MFLGTRHHRGHLWRIQVIPFYVSKAPTIVLNNKIQNNVAYTTLKITHQRGKSMCITWRNIPVNSNTKSSFSPRGKNRLRSFHHHVMWPAESVLQRGDILQHDKHLIRLFNLCSVSWACQETRKGRVSPAVWSDTSKVYSNPRHASRENETDTSKETAEPMLALCDAHRGTARTRGNNWQGRWLQMTSLVQNAVNTLFSLKQRCLA